MRDIGDKKTVTIPPTMPTASASRKRRSRYRWRLFPSAPQVGWVVELTTPEGQQVQAVVAEVDELTATIDFNHPLAGEDLTFEIELVDVVSKG